MYCKNCGTSIIENEAFCSKCGAKIEISGKKKENICPVCETINSADAANCAICGADLSNIASEQMQNNQQNNEPFFCMHCGAPNKSTDVFCNSCGKNLREKPTPIVPPTPIRREKSYTPLIITLIIVALLCVGAAVFVIASNSLFVSTDNYSSSEETQKTSEEPTEEQTEEPTEEPTERPASTPTPVPTPYYSMNLYATYKNGEYDFSCPYPAYMRSTSSASDSKAFIRNTFEADDGTVLYMCGTTKAPDQTPQTVSKNFKTTGYSTIQEEIPPASNYCSVLISDGNTDKYCYYNLSEGMVRGFEMHFSTSYRSTYIEYADDMRENISL